MPAKLPSADKLRSLIAEVRTETTKRKTGYAHPYSHYAKQYGRSEKQIKRYAAKSAPLDDPDKMGDWLKPGRGGEPPDDFQEDPPRQRAGADGEDGDLAEARARMAEGRMEAMPFRKMASEGLEAEINRLQMFAQQAALDVREAIAKGIPRRTQDALDIYSALLDQLRKFEKDTPGILARVASQVSIADVETEVGKLIAAFVQAADALPGRAAGKISGGMEYHDRLEVLQDEVQILKRTLAKCLFLPTPVMPPRRPRPIPSPCPLTTTRRSEPRR